MGLDIYVHKTRHQEGDCVITSDNYSSICSDEKERAVALLSRDYMDCVRVLAEAEAKKVDSDTYKKLYTECIDKLKPHFDYPQYSLDVIGFKQELVEWDDPENHDTRGHWEYVYDPVPVSVWIEKSRKIIESHYAPSVAYFRKVNFIFAYFQNRDSMINECFAFMPKHVCLDLIDRCKKVLADHSLAAELLPTQAGFFFGSTEYDDWYFKDVEDCLKQLTEKCLPVYDEPCWEPGEVADQYKDEKMNLYWYFSW